ncbi:polysaccharide deacetylase family protein [Paenibacillus sp. PAMC21692]|uniref:polysaccharide deacetylase family protein n=1 Tax=Paenibacillus sp. PAMC21692 TaxID=2762320 RepID=UPI0021C4A40F|nr:polysaccharide deacetylase family protein [Paenibacillus sp. PAMC21692]
MKKNSWCHGLIGMISIVLLCGFAPQAHNRNYYEMRGEAMWEVATDEQLIAFTFDDGPNANITPLILDLLKEYEAKATFFVVGNRIDKNVDIIRRQADEGHEVANHTFSHVFFNGNQSLQAIDDEILQTKHKIEEVTGQDSPWFRPPGGYINDSVISSARKHGYTVTLWSWHQDTKDWRSPGVDAIVKKVLNNAHNGDIVLMHDNVQGSTQTYRALKIILPELKARGFRFVTISDLVKSKRSNEAHQGDVGE